MVAILHSSRNRSKSTILAPIISNRIDALCGALSRLWITAKVSYPLSSASDANPTKNVEISSDTITSCRNVHSWKSDTTSGAFHGARVFCWTILLFRVGARSTNCCNSLWAASNEPDEEILTTHASVNSTQDLGGGKVLYFLDEADWFIFNLH